MKNTDIGLSIFLRTLAPLGYHLLMANPIAIGTIKPMSRVPILRKGGESNLPPEKKIIAW